MCFAGILLVGASSLMTGSGRLSQSASATVVGMLLIVLAQAVQAAQVTIEDHVLRDLGLAPLTVVGWEGIWGCIFMFGILLPIAQVGLTVELREQTAAKHFSALTSCCVLQFLPGRDGGGIHEDNWDTLHMISHSIPPWTIPSALVGTGDCFEHPAIKASVYTSANV